MAKTYEYFWVNKWLTGNAKNIEEMAAMLHLAANELEEMHKAGVVMRDNDGAFITLITTKAKVAKKFGFELIEEEFDDESPMP